MPRRSGRPDPMHPLEIHLVGIGLSHALTPVVHNYLAEAIDVPWRIKATECRTIDDCVRIFRSDRQAGGIVTMPFKGEILKHLDRIDSVASTLKACNSVYFDEDGKLCGSNTDWIGVEGALRSAGFDGKSTDKDITAALIGAGGAARAAVYALSACFGIQAIYVLNRDDEEVAQLVEDCDGMPCQLQRLKSVEDSVGRNIPSVIVGSIPDYEAISPDEKAVKQVYEHLLSQGEGIMIDFCYNPLYTRNLQLARDHGWRTIQGIEVVGHQVEALWRLWIDHERLNKLDREGMWKVLREAAALDAKGRQALNAKIIKRRFGD